MNHSPGWRQLQCRAQESGEALLVCPVKFGRSPVRPFHILKLLRVILPCSFLQLGASIRRIIFPILEEAMKENKKNLKYM